MNRQRVTFTDSISDSILDARRLRETWLQHGLRVGPSDRHIAESSVTQLYRRSGFREPEFVWVPSPPVGATLIESEGLAADMSFSNGVSRSVTARIASLITQSRERMDTHLLQRRVEGTATRLDMETARLQEPEDAARAGVGIGPIVRAGVLDSLRGTLFDGVAAAIRTLLPPTIRGVTWYGQQEAHRLAYYDIHRRLGNVRFDSKDCELLDIQSDLAGATGWWWAFDTVCVMSERPRECRTELVPGRVHGNEGYTATMARHLNSRTGSGFSRCTGP